MSYAGLSSLTSLERARQIRQFTLDSGYRWFRAASTFLSESDDAKMTQHYHVSTVYWTMLTVMSCWRRIVINIHEIVFKYLDSVRKKLKLSDTRGRDGRTSRPLYWNIKSGMTSRIYEMNKIKQFSGRVVSLWLDFVGVFCFFFRISVCCRRSLYRCVFVHEWMTLCLMLFCLS